MKEQKYIRTFSLSSKIRGSYKRRVELLFRARVPLNEERTVNLSKFKNNAELITQNYNFVQKKKESLVNFLGLFGCLNP